MCDLQSSPGHLDFTCQAWWSELKAALGGCSSALFTQKTACLHHLSLDVSLWQWQQCGLNRGQLFRRVFWSRSPLTLTKQSPPSRAERGGAAWRQPRRGFAWFDWGVQRLAFYFLTSCPQSQLILWMLNLVLFDFRHQGQLFWYASL